MNLQEALINSNLASEKEIANAKIVAKTKYVAIMYQDGECWHEYLDSEKDAILYYENNIAWADKIEIHKIETDEFIYLVEKSDGFYTWVDKYDSLDEAKYRARQWKTDDKSYVKIYKVIEEILNF